MVSLNPWHTLYFQPKCQLCNKNIRLVIVMWRVFHQMTTQNKAYANDALEFCVSCTKILQILWSRTSLSNPSHAQQPNCVAIITSSDTSTKDILYTRTTTFKWNLIRKTKKSVFIKFVTDFKCCVSICDIVFKIRTFLKKFH